MQAKQEKRTHVEYLIRNQALQGPPGPPGRAGEATDERRGGEIFLAFCISPFCDVF